MAVPARRRRWRSARRSAGVEPARAAQRRLAVLAAVMGLAFAVLIGQLFRLQVLNTGYYRLKAEGNRLWLRSESAPRGLIYDRNGQLLAQNVPSFSVVVVPANLPRGREGEIYAVLQQLLRVPAFAIEEQVYAARRGNDPFAPIVIKRELDPQTALILAERRRDLPGVEVQHEPVRHYPAGELTAHLLGYIGRIEPDELERVGKRGYRLDDRIGKAGVELTYEGDLHGVPGRREVEVDAAGRELRVVDEQPGRPGYNLVLSIDLELQRAVSAILSESTRDLASKKAVAIVMDVHTGELLAYVSHPTYDNNIFSHPIDEKQHAALTRNPDKPLLDHAIAEKFPPGSTFKIVTGLAALQEGVATPATTIRSTNALLVPREYDKNQSDSLPEWQAGGFGPLSFTRAITWSSNIYFYCLAAGGCEELTNDGLGNERLARYARDFGFGEPTGVDLPGETDGLVGDADWLQKVTDGARRWFKGDTYYQGIGQGYLEATPLQVVRMAAAVANGGQLLRPKAVREVRDAAGNVIVPAKPGVVRRLPISDQNMAVMREAMRQAVAEGTGRRAQIPGIQIAGKTGTAEFGMRLGAGSVYGKFAEHGWFVGFAPYENPEIAVVVFQDQGGGALTGAPTAGRIFKAYFDLVQRRAAGTAPVPARPANGSGVVSTAGRNGGR